MDNYPDTNDKALITAFASLTSKSEVKNFLRDLMTLSEIREFSNRWQIARLLWEGKKSYKEIADICRTSTTTVTRVNEYLRKQGFGGYQTALKRTSKSQS